MADPIAPDFSDVVQPIPKATAPGEISPVISVEVSYPPVPAIGLRDLIERHAVAHAAATHAKTELATALERYRVARPDPPEAIYYRFDDPAPLPQATRVDAAGRRRLIYDYPDIEELNAADPCCYSSGSADSPQGPGMAWRPDPRGIARRAEVLTAFATWKADCKRCASDVGWTDANAASQHSLDEAQRLLSEILDLQPKAFNEIVLKVRWLETLGILTEWSTIIAWDVIGLDEAMSNGQPDEEALVEEVA